MTMTKDAREIVKYGCVTLCVLGAIAFFFTLMVTLCHNDQARYLAKMGGCKATQDFANCMMAMDDK